MSDSVQTFLDTLRPMLKLVDEVLNAWNGDDRYQVPNLVSELALRLNWDSDQVRRNDPIIRAYLKDHPTWYVTRGAHGGIMKRADWLKKKQAEAEKERAKQEIKAALAAKEAAKTAVSATVVPTVTGQNK
jgi:hypothetical protein